MDEWVNRARTADIWSVLERLPVSHALKLRGQKTVGPCPSCGGKDRFSMDRRKGIFYCRRSDKGGDVIALVQYLMGADFLGAVETITGEAPPRGEHGIKQDRALIEQRRLERLVDQQRRDAGAVDYRQREIDKAAKIWRESLPLTGSPAESYLALRGLVAPAGARLRCHPALKFWHWSEAEKQFRVLHVGPAMVARMDDNANRFCGAHCTYIDLSKPKGKAEIVDPESGEVLAAKKMRGSKKGCHIHLSGDPATATALKIGEGNETVLSVHNEMLLAGRDISKQLFWTSCDLGNLGGPGVATVKHPTLTRTDIKGRVRALKVPGPDPAWPQGEGILMPPDNVRHITILGDGDSDRFSTEQHVKRAGSRWAKPDRVIAAAWAPVGLDFNNLKMGQA